MTTGHITKPLLPFHPQAVCAHQTSQVPEDRLACRWKPSSTKPKATLVQLACRGADGATSVYLLVSSPPLDFVIMALPLLSRLPCSPQPARARVRHVSAPQQP